MSTPKLPLQRILLLFTFLLVAVVLPLYAVKVYQKPDYMDFDVYYRAAFRAKALMWDQVYTLSDGASPFRYMPILIPLFRPFASFSLVTARLIWYFFQFLLFAGGFFFIYASLQGSSKTRPKAKLLTAIGILSILRLCLDTFTIGQVSGLMFFGFSLGLYGYTNGRLGLSILGIAIPTVLKIGPGVVFGSLLALWPSSQWKWKRSFQRAVLGIGALVLLLRGECGSWETFRNLWHGWAQMVALDSTYFDSTHYGSQSLNSFLLRTAQGGWITPWHAQVGHLTAAFILCLGVGVFWLFRKPEGTLDSSPDFKGETVITRGLFYSLGLFLYMWLMPETFKYSLTPLAIPFIFLLATGARHGLTRIALLACVLTLSLAGKDIVGDDLFFGNQKASLPFFATVLLGLATLREAFLRSTPKTWPWSQKPIQPWRFFPDASRKSLALSILIPIELNPLRRPNLLFIQKTLLEWKKELDRIFPANSTEGYEFLILPYHASPEGNGQINRIAPFLKEVGLSFSTEPNATLDTTRALALRTGFLKSSGTTLIACSLSQPCQASFLSEAFSAIQAGYSCVRASRRLEQSQFKTPVRYLSLVYGRHHLGVLFNRILRRLFTLHSSDILSDTFALKRERALSVFKLQSSTSFLFPLEMALVLKAHSAREKDLAVVLTLTTEKAQPQIYHEVLQILGELPRIYQRYLSRCYEPTPLFTAITADDWGLTPGVNAGILDLAKKGIVKRVSLMANGPALENNLPSLLSIPGIELGLHFNLTYGRPVQKALSPSSRLLSSGLFLGSPLRVLFQWIKPHQKDHPLFGEVQIELQEQLKKLKDLNIPIRYLDGHHHIHLLPGLIDRVAPLLKKEKIETVRLPLDFSLLFSSQSPLVFLSLWARKSLKEKGFQSLPVLYPQSSWFQDPGYVLSKMAQNPRAEIIVHPSERNDLHLLEIPDSYTAGRVIEYRTLRMLGES